MSDGVVVQHLLRERVAEEVRALLARKMMTGADLATAIDRSPMYVSRRIRGEVAFDLDDLQKIADVLGVTPLDLLPREGLNLPLRPIIRPARSTSAGTPLRRTASRPMVPTRRDLARPVSAIPAEHRRPQPTGSPGRRRAA